MCFGGCGAANVQYYSVSTRSAISIPNMYDHSCGDSLGLELLHYLLYAAAVWRKGIGGGVAVPLDSKPSGEIDYL